MKIFSLNKRSPMYPSYLKVHQNLPTWIAVLEDDIHLVQYEGSKIDVWAKTDFTAAQWVQLQNVIDYCYDKMRSNDAENLLCSITPEMFSNRSGSETEKEAIKRFPWSVMAGCPDCCANSYLLNTSGFLPGAEHQDCFVTYRALQELRRGAKPVFDATNDWPWRIFLTNNEASVSIAA
jgi:hypothetical protein